MTVFMLLLLIALFCLVFYWFFLPWWWTLLFLWREWEDWSLATCWRRFGLSERTRISTIPPSYRNSNVKMSNHKEKKWGASSSKISVARDVWRNCSSVFLVVVWVPDCAQWLSLFWLKMSLTWWGHFFSLWTSREPSS
jgi:hypothetical protein